MPKIIKNGVVSEDDWTLVRLAEGDSPESVSLPPGRLLLPLSVWRARGAELAGRNEPIGVWLAGAEGPELIADELDRFSLIAVDFAKFADGRGYSTARLLRTRYGYRGELRAIGDVLQDQLFYMRRVGFDAFAVRADKDIEQALAGLGDFSVVYQGSADPALARREAAAHPVA